MKWFKHYTDASFDNKICALEDEFGYTGYGVYWKMLEYCALQWDGKTEPKFNINKRKMRQLLRINSTKTQHILSLCDTLNLFTVINNEKEFIIEIPNLANIKDNHTKNLQAASKRVSENLPLEKKRTDKKRKENKKEKPAPSKLIDDILDLWNRNCSDFGMPKVNVLGAQRKKKLQTATKIFKNVDDWRKIFSVAANKGFTGADGRTFVPNFDYVFRNENYVKFFDEHDTMFKEEPVDQKQLEQNVVNHILSQM